MILLKKRSIVLAFVLLIRLQPTRYPVYFFTNNIMNYKGDKKSKRTAKQTSTKPKLFRRRTMEDTIREGREYLIRSKMDAEYIPDAPNISPIIKFSQTKVKDEEPEPLKRPRKDSDFDTPKKIRKTKEINIELYVSENTQSQLKSYKVIDDTYDIKKEELQNKPQNRKEKPIKRLNEDFEIEKFEPKLEPIEIPQSIPYQEIKDGTDEMDIEGAEEETTTSENILSAHIIKEITYQIISKPICEYTSLSQSKSLTCLQKPLNPLLEINSETKSFSLSIPPKINPISISSHITAKVSLITIPLTSPIIIQSQASNISVLSKPTIEPLSIMQEIPNETSNISAMAKPHIELLSITEKILTKAAEIKQVHPPMTMEKEINVAEESTESNFNMKNEENFEEVAECTIPMKRSRSFDTCIEDCPRKELKVEESCLKENFHSLNENTEPETINGAQEIRSSSEDAEIIEYDMESINVKFWQFKLLSKPRLQIELYKSLVAREKVPICFESSCKFRVLPELHGLKIC
ncbi:unnamed protein product [Blepharisma stoltei]|uniref:Zonadhesin n=1 Tax=Blepharisma stoltei TaxID=1481888 RepID=A0AAU9JYJ4_9CILI|nr:unnamed protein product [Blepharisma stoltei]